MFADSHIHVGQFREIYEQPKELVKYLFKVGVTHFAVSSTSICKDNYIKAIAEIREVITLAPSCVFPILWITPLSLQNGGVILKVMVFHLLKIIIIGILCFLDA